MSDRAATRRRFGIAGVVGLLAFGAGSANAQRGILRGVVVDSSGAPIPGAEVTIFSLGRVTRSDSLGRLRFLALPPGTIDLVIRHLGYHARTERVLITGAPYDSIRVTLMSQDVSLTQVDVSAIGRHPYFAGFDERRARGVGSFVTRAQIDASNTGTPTDLLRNLPQVRVVRSGGRLLVRFPSNMSVRGRGSALCTPMMWLDGQRAAGMEIDDMRATDIEAIEVYRGASTTPPQFATGGANQCGAIVVWTRRKG